MEKSKLNRRPIGSTTRYQAGVSGVYNNRKQPTLSNGHSTANELRDASSWHLPTISLGLAPVAVILLLFGGRPTLITICLAGIFAYIIDIVGFVEGSVLVLTGMFAGIFITLTYAARFIIGESIFNFPFIVTFGVALLYCFFCILLQFQSLLNEGDRFLSALHTWVIITMPSVCSAIITWFISIEIPALDIGICYSIVYFLYMLLLTTPKDTPKSMTFSIKKGLEGIGSNSASNTAIKQSKRIPVFDVPNQTLLLMYMLPVIVSMLLYIDLHHFRFKYESIFHEFIGITISMAFPCVLMSLCAEFQIEFYCDVIRNAKNSVSDARLIRRNDTIHKQYICKKLFGFGGLELLRICQLGSFCCLLLALHDHPVLDDIKAFAKWNKDVASLLIIIGCMSLLGAIVSARRCRSNNNRAKDEDAVLVTDVYVGVCSVVCTASFGLLLGMPVYVLPACIGGVLLFLEFYERSFDFKNVYSLYLAIIFVLCAGLSSCVVTLCFTQRTIWFLNYDLESHLFNGSFITMQLFSNVCAMMTCLAVVIPPLLSKSTNGNGVIRELASENVSVGESFMSDTLGYIPESVKNSGNGSGGILDSSLSNSLSNAITYVFESTASILPTKFSSFSILYTLMCLLITFLELLIREQVNIIGIISNVFIALIYTVLYALLCCSWLMFLFFNAHRIGVVRAHSFLRSMWKSSILLICASLLRFCFVGQCYSYQIVELLKGRLL